MINKLRIIIGVMMIYFTYERSLPNNPFNQTKYLNNTKEYESLKKFTGKLLKLIKFRGIQFRYDEDTLKKAIDDTIDFIIMNSNGDVINNLFQNEKCLQSMEGLFNGSIDIMKMIINSGKSMNDLGLQDDCEKNNEFSYFFMQFEFNEQFLNLTDFIDILKFTAQDTFFIGACFVSNCKSFFRDYFNSTMNKEFFSILEKGGIININAYGLHNNSFDLEIISLDFKIYCILFLVYLAFRIIVSIVGKTYFTYSYYKEDDVRSENIQGDELDMSTIRSS
jgi:hypothetical protein